ncbi:MAG: class I SAM-dependent methyltransferase [Acutalibacter sp.]|nr:class I SAM-dependent methyltransferase [Acutalibacter sp.]
MENYQDINASTIDRWVEEGWEWGKPISHQEYLDALAGNWKMFLTPTKPVPKEWFGGSLKGKKVLGLASGGGQQMPIFAALGAECAVLDYSPCQIESERMVSEREGYQIRIIRADMTKPLPFEDGEFDLIFHPVSNCYVREVKPIFRECYRVLKPGGILLSGLDNGVNFFFIDEEHREKLNFFPFDPLTNPEQRKMLEEEDDGMQFSHTMEEQIGGQLEAGFRLTHLYEDTNGEGTFHEHNIPSFVATRAVKEK